MQKFSIANIGEGVRGLCQSKSFRQGLLGALIIVVISVAFFATSLGESLRQNDMMQGMANGQEAKAFYEETGEKTLWTNSLFSGMPTFQIAPSYGSSKFISVLQTICGLGLPSPINLVFMMMAGFYILMLAMRQRWQTALLGAVAYGFSSYFFIIIGAGHIWKFCVLAYVPPTIAGLVLCYRGRLLAGGALTAVFAALQIASNHVQMTYYFLFVVALLMIAAFVDAARRHELTRWMKATGVLMVAALLAVAANLTSLYNTYEYSKETIRGRTTLLSAKSDGGGSNVNANGINRGQVTAWSYGIDETLTLIIPNAKGGATVKPNDVNDEGGLTAASVIDLQKAQDLVGQASITGDEGQDAQLRPQLQEFVGSFRQYFGDQPMTNGPVYAGIIIFALALLALFVCKGPVKWALLAASIISVLLAWGHNFPALTYWMIDHFPMYDKFRAPASILVIIEFTLPILAVMALNEMSKDKEFLKNHRKALVFSFGAPALACLIAAVFPQVMGSGLSVVESEQMKEMLQDAGLLERSFYTAGFDIVAQARLLMVTADAVRGLIFVAAGFAIVWFYLRGKVKADIAVLALTAVVLIDMFSVDKRYLNEGMFVGKSADTQEAFVASAADNEILQDRGYYRVMDVTAFGSATPSYFHKSVGGYHAAKLTRYNDLIERQIDPAKNALIQQARSGALDLSKINMNALNMLNTKYLLFADSFVLPNPNALGNAWLVDDVKYVKGADAEMDALTNIDPAVTAVADEQFSASLGTATKADGDTIYMSAGYKPNELHYHANTAKGGVAVFSEIYFPWGWHATIDGKDASIARVDYTLRALRLPAGGHDIVMRFDPQSIHTTEAVAHTAIAVIYALLLAALVFTLCRGNNRKTDGE